MTRIFITSDTHFNHNRPFIYAARGFQTVEAMNAYIVERWNALVEEEDIVYHLGDVFLGDNEAGMAVVRKLKGRLRIVIGNHDTKPRIALLRAYEKVESLSYGEMLYWHKRPVLLTHFPTVTSNAADGHKEQRHICTYNLCGHTHQTNPFFDAAPLSYNAGMDAHGCTPILFEDAMKELEEHCIRLGIFEDEKKNSL